MSNRGHSNDAAKAAALLEAFSPGVLQSLKFVYALFITFCEWFAVTLEVFIRHDFGERYLNPVKVFMGFSLIWPIALFGSIFLGGNRWNWPLVALQLGFLGMAVYHYVQIRLRNRRGVLWHSQSFGVSYLERVFTTFNDWTLYRVVEPALFYFIGVLVLAIHAPLGVWLIVAASALFVKNNMLYAQQREVMLDLIDAKIDAGFTAAALEGKPKRETAGISRVSLPQPIAKEIKALADTAASAPLDFSDLIAVQLRRETVPVAVPVVQDEETPDFSDLINEQMHRPVTDNGAASEERAVGQ